MNPYGISPKSYVLMMDAFAKYPEIESVVLFGSRAKGNFHQGSDIDLALNGENCSPLLALNVSGLLNEELPIPYFFDVLDYATIDNVDLKEHIDQVGVALYQKTTVLV